MIRSITEARQFAACTGGQAVIAGANRGATLGFFGTAGGGYFYLDRSPRADPMHLDSLAATVFEEANSAARLGVQVWLGRLSGQQVEAVDWLAVGILNSADPWVRLNRRVFAPFGVCMYVHGALTSGTYVFKLQGGIWRN